MDDIRNEPLGSILLPSYIITPCTQEDDDVQKKYAFKVGSFSKSVLYSGMGSVLIIGC